MKYIEYGILYVYIYSTPKKHTESKINIPYSLLVPFIIKRSGHELHNLLVELRLREGLGQHAIGPVLDEICYLVGMDVARDTCRYMEQVKTGWSFTIF